MPLLIRFLSLLWRYRWLLVAIGAALVAKHFMPAESWKQVLATLEKFVWLVVACFALFALAQLLKYLTARNDRRK